MMLKTFLKLLLFADAFAIIAVIIWAGINLEHISRQQAQQAILPTSQVTGLAPIIPSLTPFQPSYVTAATTSSPTVVPPTATLSFTEQGLIGYSVAGRPLIMYRFGIGTLNRLIIGGIHGGSEANTVQLAEKFIDYINANPDTIPPDITLYILPVLNADGYERSLGTKGRANENGVDINRNFDAFWSLDWSREGCWNYGPISAGTAPDSEPETRTLEAFLLDRKIDALISYHSAALGIFAGGQPPDQNSIKLAEALHAVSKYPYPPVDTGCKYTGQLIDWASIHNIAAVDIELSTHNEMDYEINLKVLDRFLNWAK